MPESHGPNRTRACARAKTSPPTFKQEELAADRWAKSRCITAEIAFLSQRHITCRRLLRALQPNCQRTNDEHHLRHSPASAQKTPPKRWPSRGGAGSGHRCVRRSEG
jgi:hypothetical protein